MTPGNTTRSRLGLAAACSSLLILVACGGTSGDSDDSGGSTAGTLTGDYGAADSAANRAAENSGAAPSTGSGSTGPGTTTNNQSALPFDRKIVYSTALELAVPDVSGSFNEIQRIVRIEGGYVEKSNLSVRQGEESSGPQSASLTLRVPVAGFDPLLNGIRSLSGAKVTREEASSNEVTEQYTDLQSRLRNLEANEKQYLELLGTAKTINDILTLNDRLSTVRGEIETVTGRLNLLDHMTEMATVSVALKLPSVASQVQEPKDDGGIATPAEAFEAALDVSKDSLRVLGAAGAFGIVALAWAAPFAAIGLIARRLTRNRRTATPPAPPTPEPGV